MDRKEKPNCNNMCVYWDEMSEWMLSRCAMLTQLVWEPEALGHSSDTSRPGVDQRNLRESKAGIKSDTDGLRGRILDGLSRVNIPRQLQVEIDEVKVFFDSTTTSTSTRHQVKYYLGT